MNHFISGILKIVLLEGSIALLLIDAVAGDRFEKVRSRAHGVLAGLMVFAWCNYASLRANIDVPQVLTSIPLILFCGFLIGFAFDPRTRRARRRVRGVGEGGSPRLGRWTSLFTTLAVITLLVALDLFSAGPLLFGAVLSSSVPGSPEGRRAASGPCRASCRGCSAARSRWPSRWW